MRRQRVLFEEQAFQRNRRQQFHNFLCRMAIAVWIVNPLYGCAKTHGTLGQPLSNSGRRRVNIQHVSGVVATFLSNPNIHDWKPERCRFDDSTAGVPQDRRRMLEQTQVNTMI